SHRCCNVAKCNNEYRSDHLIDLFPEWIAHRSCIHKMNGLCVPPVTHVIFDLDGLLIDSEPIYAEVNRRVMAKYGKQYSTELKKLTMGMRQDPAVELMIEKVGLKGKVTLQEYTAAYDALLPELLPNCRMMPGAMRFVEHLARHNIPFAICTGSRSMECDLKLRNLKQLTDLVPLMVRGEDPEIRNGKPAPDCFLVTMNRFKEKPKSASNVAVFEDSPNGIRAAVGAGMRAVMIPDVRYASPPEDIKDRITMVLRSFEEFLPESLGLPPYNDGYSNN
uniref:Uncharacterized protein n=1 Tax=Parascaris univalens TaxID=6257 RepID=A0A915C593_PARUN